MCAIENWNSRRITFIADYLRVPAAGDAVLEADEVRGLFLASFLFRILLFLGVGRFARSRNIFTAHFRATRSGK